MAIRVALHHKTTYKYSELVKLGPQLVRLRPAPHCRTPVLSYSLKVQPKKHFVNWQQDPYGNFQARYVFPEPVKQFDVTVDLVADMSVINPFDFFIESSAEESPFQYEDWLKEELAPFLKVPEAGPLLSKYLKTIDRTKRNTVNFLVDLNSQLQHVVSYTIRMEPGVQSPEETLEKASGSCRDSAWLLVHLLRHLGFAARFVSGYLIQLKPDVKSLDGPSGTEVDFTDLHAWTEVFLPGAGWVGLDPTSGLLAGEGHIPLACSPQPQGAAPISGGVDECEVEFDFEMKLTRVHEDPRVTKPYTQEQWQSIEQLGRDVDQRLQDRDVRLTMGGEPTFVSIDDMEGPEWTNEAVGVNKRKLSGQLIQRLRDRFAPGALLHFGQGKWYPGESLPRWALACLWRKDGQPIWNNAELIADETKDYGFGPDEAKSFAKFLCAVLGISSKWAHPAYEDVPYYLWKEDRLPVNVTPEDSKLDDPEERSRLASLFKRGLGSPTGYLLPLKRQWWQGNPRWLSGPWPMKSGHVYLLPGDSPIGLRLPLEGLPYAAPEPLPSLIPKDPMDEFPPLPSYQDQSQRYAHRKDQFESKWKINPQEVLSWEADDEDFTGFPVVRTALTIEPREGRLHLFMPPTERFEDYLELLTAIEQTCEALDMPVIIEGYLPPYDPRLETIKVTPDPGVIEVNVHPTSNWDELVEVTRGVYEDAHFNRLGTEKFDLDGKHSGTGGGNHFVLGGKTPADSPFLRRPDLLKSLIGFWNNHPSLSYLFSGRFIGPTSQAPRIDEGRRDSIYEMQIAFNQVPPAGQHCPPWLVDRIFRNLLTDLTGNTHRAEFCIDKLYSPDGSTGRLGLLELRGFEMPPHAEMSLTQQLLIRGLVARAWDAPWEEKLTEWRTSLHDRYLLPHFVEHDFRDVIDDLRAHNLPFEADWFLPHFEFRFPKVGELKIDEIQIELRNALEPWYVLGEENAGGGTARFVDSSVERLQVKVKGLVADRFLLTCNQFELPLHSTGTEGEYVAAVRFRAWQPPSCLHPNIPVHTPLTFDLYDTWTKRSLGGCVYYVSHPAGRNYETFPVNAYEAEARRQARFFPTGHSPGAFEPVRVRPNAYFPMTLDLRNVSPEPSWH